jgi:hypothetical protein
MLKKSMIKQCSCTHEYQDENYGAGNRVFNLFGKDNEKARCTVCNRECSSSDGAERVSKKKTKK